MQRMLECDVCSDFYDTRTRVPKSLLCGHGYCTICLDNMLEGSIINCPKCRVTCEVSEGKVNKLPTNYAILELLESVCAECKNRPHTKRCGHCKQNLCDDCRNSHTKGSKSDIGADMNSLKKLVSRLTQICNDDSELLKIKNQGDDVVDDLTRAHQARIQRMEQIYEQQVSEVQTRVSEDRNLHRKWRESVKEMLEDANSLLEQSGTRAESGKGARRDGISPEQTRCRQLLSSLTDKEHGKPGITKIWFSDMMEEFQILVTKCGKVNMSIGSKEPRTASKKPTVVTNLLNQVSLEPDYTKAKFKVMIGGRGNNPGEFKNPRGILSGHMGQIVVADWLNERIQILDSGLQLIRTVMIDGAFDMCELDGYLFVTQSNKQQISILTEKGELVRTIVSDRFGGASFEEPRGITSDKRSLLYVCDCASKCIKVINTTGTFTRKFGRDVFTDVGPRYIEIFRNKVLVSDNNYNLHVFSTNGDLTSTMRAGSPPSNIRATGIATDSHGNIIVADSAGRLVVIKEDGHVVSVIGSNGRSEGQMRSPEGVTVTSEGDIVVCDAANDRIITFSIPTY